VTETTSEEGALRMRIEQLKRDLGHGRSNGYTLQALREAIDGRLADLERASWLPGCEPAEVAAFRRLHQIAHTDHASDMFSKPGKQGEG
jgi:hypothetical protein